MLPQVLFPAFPRFLEEIFFAIAEDNQRRWLEESIQWLENDDRTHLVLTSGKLVLKKFKCCLVEKAICNLWSDKKS